MTTTSTTETKVTIDLGEIGVARRLAIHEADAKYDPLMQESGKALFEAYAELGKHVAHNVPNIDRKDGQFRRLLDKIEERTRADAENYIGLQGEHEEIERRFNQLTVEYFAKNPIPSKGASS
jgi:hypothetical protein